MSIDTIQLDRLELTEGDDYFQEYLIVDSDDNPVDITGWAANFAAKENLDDTTPLWNIAGVIDADQVTNKGRFSFTGTVPTAFSGKYTIQIITSGADINTEVAGGSDIRIFPSANPAP